MAVEATYIFMDVDGVVIKGYHHNPKYRRAWDENMERDLGVSGEGMQKHFWPHFSDVTSGKRDLVEALTDVLPHINFKCSVQEIIDYWFKADSILDTELLSLLSTIKNTLNVRLYLATNQERMRADYLWNQLKLSSLFTDIYFSGKLGVGKPDPIFFSKINDDLGLDPDQNLILFFDDHPENVASAKHAGWNAFLYETIDDFSQNPFIKDLLSKSVSHY